MVVMLLPLFSLGNLERGGEEGRICIVISFFICWRAYIHVRPLKECTARVADGYIRTRCYCEIEATSP